MLRRVPQKFGIRGWGFCVRWGVGVVVIGPRRIIIEHGHHDRRLHVLNGMWTREGPVRVVIVIIGITTCGRKASDVTDQGRDRVCHTDQNMCQWLQSWSW